MDAISGAGILFWALPIITWALLFFIGFALFETRNQVRELLLVVLEMADEQQKLNRYLATVIEPPEREPDPAEETPSLAEQVRQLRGGL